MKPYRAISIETKEWVHGVHAYMADNGTFFIVENDDENNYIETPAYVNTLGQFLGKYVEVNKKKTPLYIQAMELPYGINFEIEVIK